MADPGPVHRLDAHRVGQHQVAMRQQPAIARRLQIPVARQSDDGHRPSPKRRRNAVVLQVQDQQIGPPPVGQFAEDVVPIVVMRDLHVDARLRAKAEALSILTLHVKVLLRKFLLDRASVPLPEILAALAA
jgi:hypothetical protein